MKIVGLADIQIRNNTREKEYRFVFEKLYSKLKELKPDRIAIAGDIFHHKSTLSPESVSLAPEFFKNLSDIAPLDVIPGNHDVGKDLKRIDAVKAIVEKNMKHWVLKNPINYYGTEGVYTIDDKHCYFVWDFRNKKHNRLTAPENTISIGLFHGAPYNMRLDDGKSMPSVIEEKVFENVDFMICGDIHKREFWNNRKYVMVGSLICQNFSEEYYQHGFVMIDTESGEVTEHNIENDWGYFTITDKHIKIDENNKASVVAKVPFKEYILRTKLENNYTDEQVAQIKLSIKKKYKKDVTITVYVDPKEYVKDYNTVDLSNPNVQNGLIEEYCKKNKISNIDRLKEINIEMNRKLRDSSDNMYNVKWSPIKLRFKNVFAFGDVESVIDFTKLSGITAISGANGVGKSSMFSVMLFLLFGKTPKISVQGEVINDRKDDCFMEFTLKVENDIYRITKELIKKRKNISSSLSFEKWDDVEKEFIADDAEKNEGQADTIKDIKQTISKILGNYDDVLISTFSLQNDFSKILKSGETERRNYVYNFLGVNIFQQLHKVSSAYETKYENVLKQYSDIDFDTEIKSCELDITNFTDKIEKLKQLKLKYFKVIDDIDKTISNKMASMGALSEKMKKSSELSEVKNDIATKTNEISNNNVLISRNKDILHSHELKLRDFKTIDIKFEMDKVISIMSDNSSNIDKYNKQYEKEDEVLENLKKKQKLNNEIQEKINSLSNKISQLNINIQNYKRQSDILIKQPWMRNLEQCKSCQLAKDAFESDELLKKSNEIKSKSELIKDKMQKQIIPNVSDLLEQANDTIKNINKEIKKLVSDNEQLSTTKDNLQKIENSIKDIELSIEKVSSNIIVAEQRNDLLRGELQKSKILLTELESIEGEIKEYNKLENEVKDLNSDKVLNKSRIESVETGINELTEKIGSHRTKIQTLKSQEKEYESAVFNAMIYKTYRQIVNKDGLPFTILQRFIPMFNKKISEYLTEDIANFKLKFEIEDDKLKILVQKFGDNWRDVKSTGGAEEVISSWIIRAVLSEFSILPKSDMFIIDEGFGAFDQNNISNVEILFEKFKQKFSKILVISHVPIITDFCDNLVEVVVDDDGYSYIGN